MDLFSVGLNIYLILVEDDSKLVKVEYLINLVLETAGFTKFFFLNFMLVLVFCKKVALELAAVFRTDSTEIQ